MTEPDHGSTDTHGPQRPGVCTPGRKSLSNLNFFILWLALHRRPVDHGYAEINTQTLCNPIRSYHLAHAGMPPTSLGCTGSRFVRMIHCTTVRADLSLQMSTAPFGEVVVQAFHPNRMVALGATGISSPFQRASKMDIA